MLTFLPPPSEPTVGRTAAMGTATVNIEVLQRFRTQLLKSNSDCFRSSCGASGLLQWQSLHWNKSIPHLSCHPLKKDPEKRGWRGCINNCSRQRHKTLLLGLVATLYQLYPGKSGKKSILKASSEHHCWTFHTCVRKPCTFRMPYILNWQITIRACSECLLFLNSHSKRWENLVKANKIGSFLDLDQRVCVC